MMEELATSLAGLIDALTFIVVVIGVVFILWIFS